MCLVYMYWCPRCSHVKRNYRRWPKFCKKDYCVRLHSKQAWVHEGPCLEKPCQPEDCNIVVRKQQVVCPDCRIERKEYKKWEEKMAQDTTLVVDSEEDALPQQPNEMSEPVKDQ